MDARNRRSIFLTDNADRMLRILAVDMSRVQFPDETKVRPLPASTVIQHAISVLFMQAHPELFEEAKETARRAADAAVPFTEGEALEVTRARNEIHQTTLHQAVTMALLALEKGRAALSARPPGEDEGGEA